MKTIEREVPLSDIVDETGHVRVACAVTLLWFEPREGFDFSAEQAEACTLSVTINKRLSLFFGRAVRLKYALKPFAAVVHPPLVLQPGFLFEMELDPYVAKALECKVRARFVE